jgi:hypothetical protein
LPVSLFFQGSGLASKAEEMRVFDTAKGIVL